MDHVKSVKTILDAQNVVVKKTIPVVTTLCKAYLRAFPINETHSFHSPSPFPGNYRSPERPSISLNYLATTVKSPGGAYFLARHLLAPPPEGLEPGPEVRAWGQQDLLITLIDRRAFPLVTLSTSPLLQVHMPDTPGVDAGGLTRNFFGQMYLTFFSTQQLPPPAEGAEQKTLNDLTYGDLNVQLQEPNDANIKAVVNLLSRKAESTQPDRKFEEHIAGLALENQKNKFAQLLHTNHLFGSSGRDYTKEFTPEGAALPQQVQLLPQGLLPDSTRFDALTQQAKERLLPAYKALGRVYFLSMVQSRPMASLASHLIYSALQRNFNPAQQKLGMLLEFYLRSNPITLMTYATDFSQNINRLAKELQNPHTPFNTEEFAGIMDERTGHQLQILKNQDLEIFKREFFHWLKTTLKQEVGENLSAILQSINEGFWDMANTQRIEHTDNGNKTNFLQRARQFFNKINTYLHDPHPTLFFLDEDYRTYAADLSLANNFIRSDNVTLLLMQDVIGLLSPYDFTDYLTPTIDINVLRALLTIDHGWGRELTEADQLAERLFRTAFDNYLSDDENNQEELKRFLIFVTGAPVPTAPYKISLIPERNLTEAHTCFLRWDVGIETIKIEMRKKAREPEQINQIKGWIKNIVAQSTTGMQIH